MGDLQWAGHRLDAQLGRIAHRWSQRGVWSSDGSKSAAARLARDGHRSRRSARAILSRGRRLSTAPLVAASFADGVLSADQADVLLGAAAGREELFARDEQLLVGQARTLRFDALRKVLHYWRNRVDTELGSDGDEPTAAPTLTLTSVGDLVAVDGQLDPIGGAIVTSALDTIADQLAADDRECARPTRPRRELRAAALVEMARRATAMPDSAQRARILMQIVCGHDSFAGLCELSNGTIIRPAQIVPYLDSVDVRTIMFDSATHAVATSSQRTFTGALRGVIQARDRHCQHPCGCDEPINRCDIDHTTPWHNGGQTSQDNGRLLCRYHNRIEPQHTRPPTPSDEADEHQHDEWCFTDLTELLRASTRAPNGEWHIYEIPYTDLLEHGP